MRVWRKVGYSAKSVTSSAKEGEGKLSLFMEIEQQWFVKHSTNRFVKLYTWTGQVFSPVRCLAKHQTLWTTSQSIKTHAPTPVWRSLMTSQIIPPIPNSENNLHSKPSIHTVSKALRTSRNQLKALLPCSSIWLMVLRIVNDASVHPAPFLKPNCLSENNPFCET